MSVLSNPYVVPSRVAGLFRLLLTLEGQRERRETIERMLMPDPLLSDEQKRDGRPMLASVISECLEMGLMESEGEDLRLAGALREKVRVLRQDSDVQLPAILTRLLFNREGERNHDLGRIMAWYLTLDPMQSVSHWDMLPTNHLEVARSLNVCSNLRWDQFRYWLEYLGLGWAHTYSAKRTLVPDPTACLRSRLIELLGGERRRPVPLSDAMRRMGELWPVLEGGFLRQEIENQTGSREAGHLSPATSMAWFRLQDEETVKLIHNSDAPVKFIFSLGSRTESYTDIQWLSH